MGWRTKSPKKIGDILDELLKKKDFHLKIKEKQLFIIWEDVVGEIAKSAQPLKLKRGTLVVSCKSPAWAQEMEFRKQDIIDKLNKELKMSLIKKIYFITTPEKFKEE